MRIHLPLPSIALFAVLASGQTVDRVFQFVHTDTTQSMQEIATAMRTVGEIKNVTVDTAAKSVTVSGTPEQIGFAEWLFAGLDRIVPVQPDPAAHEYRLTGGPDNIVRLYYIDHGQSVQEFQELATALRTVGDIRRVYTYNAAKALIVRGTADQIAMSDWGLSEIWKHGNLPGPRTMSGEYLLPADPAPRPNENVVRVFYVENSPTVQDFQELATIIRSVANVRRVFTYNAPRAILVRGTVEQIALAIWLFNEIDQATAARQTAESAPYKYQLAGFPEDTVRVFYLSHTGSAQDFQQISNQVRSGANIKNAFAYAGKRALALRGTGEQIDAAERLLTQLDPADFPGSRR